MLGIEGILGTGIFVLTEYAGSALVISFILSGLVCVFTAPRYSELAPISPFFGSVYKYGDAGYGVIQHVNTLTH